MGSQTSGEGRDPLSSSSVNDLPSALETPRLLLEPITPNHSPGMWRAIEASLPDLRRWLAWALETSEQRIGEWAEEAGRRREAGTDWPFVIIYAGEPAGVVGIHRRDLLQNQATIGYWLRSDLAGRGLITEAASAAVEFAFHGLGLHRLELRAAPANLASIRIAEKLGFQKEGLLRGATRSSEGYEDAFVFGLLATDPRPGFHLG